MYKLTLFLVLTTFPTTYSWSQSMAEAMYSNLFKEPKELKIALKNAGYTLDKEDPSKNIYSWVKDSERKGIVVIS